VLAPRIAVELFFGYLQLAESATRRIYAEHEGQAKALYSNDYRDETKLAGPIAALSASYRFLDRTPIAVRLWVGVGRLSVRTTNSGRFTGNVSFDGASIPVDQPLSIAERSQTVWAPLAGPEVRFGYQLSDNFSADVGVAALLLVPSSAPRTGTWVGSKSGRSAPLFVTGRADSVGVYKLPDEEALGTALVLVPSLAARYRF
jgi:hypothetical protein